MQESLVVTLLVSGLLFMGAGLLARRWALLIVSFSLFVSAGFGAWNTQNVFCEYVTGWECTINSLINKDIAITASVLALFSVIMTVYIILEPSNPKDVEYS